MGFGSGGGYRPSPNNIQGDATVTDGNLTVENTSGAVLTISGSGGDGTDTYLSIEGNGDVGIRLIADKNDSDETDNPYIDFYQDGQGVDPRTRNRRVATMGLESGNGSSFTDSYGNGLYIDAYYPSSPNTGRTFQIATDSTSNGHVARISIESSNGFIGFHTNAPTQVVDINDDSIRVRTAKTPASAGADGDQGQIAWDADYIYICVATNTWKRVAISTWV